MLCILLFLSLPKDAINFQVERKDTNGDVVFSSTIEQCKKYSNSTIWRPNGECQCAAEETILNVAKEQQPKCYSGIGTELGCNIVDMTSRTKIKSYSNKKTSKTILVDFGKSFNKCPTKNWQFEMWDRYKGWNKVDYFAIKTVSTGFSIGFAERDYATYQQGKLFKLILSNCPKKNLKSCFLFKALGKETRPSTTKAPPTTTTTSPTMLPTTTEKTTLVAAVTNGDSSSSIVAPIIGVTFFIIVIIVGIVVFVIWFRKKHGHDENMGEWLKEKVYNKKGGGKKRSSLRSHNEYNGLDTKLPVIPNFPPRPSPSNYHENKGLHDDDVYLTPVPTPKTMKGSKSDIVQEDFYDMVADDEHIDANASQDIYDAVADSEMPAVSNDIYDMVADEQLYDIVEENNVKASMKKKNNSVPTITVETPQSYPFYNEELPPSPLVKNGPASYSCLGQVKDNREQYCTLNSKNQANDLANQRLNTADISPSSSLGSQAHLYFETEIGS